MTPWNAEHDGSETQKETLSKDESDGELGLLEGSRIASLKVPGDDWTPPHANTLNKLFFRYTTLLP